MNTSLAKSSNYYMIFGSKKLSNIRYYLQELNLPGLSLEPIIVPNSTRNFLVTGGDIQFPELNFKIIIDETFSNYLYLLEEIFSYKNPETGEIKVNPFDTDIFITTNKGNPFLKFTLKNGYISSLDSVQFTEENQNDDVLTININFKYSNLEYKILDTNILPNFNSSEYLSPYKDTSKIKIEKLHVGIYIKTENGFQLITEDGSALII